MQQLLSCVLCFVRPWSALRDLVLPCQVVPVKGARACITTATVIAGHHCWGACVRGSCSVGCSPRLARQGGLPPLPTLQVGSASLGPGRGGCQAAGEAVDSRPAQHAAARPRRTPGEPRARAHSVLLIALSAWACASRAASRPAGLPDPPKTTSCPQPAHTTTHRAGREARQRAAVWGRQHPPDQRRQAV